MRRFGWHPTSAKKSASTDHILLHMIRGRMLMFITAISTSLASENTRGERALSSSLATSHRARTKSITASESSWSVLPKTTLDSSGVSALKISLGGGSNSRSCKRNLSTGVIEGCGFIEGSGAAAASVAASGALFSSAGSGLLAAAAFFRCAKGDSSPPPPPPPNIPDMELVGIMNEGIMLSVPPDEDEDE